MKKAIFCISAAAMLSAALQAQVCDPSGAPTGLVSTYTPGSGALLEWDPVPGSVGVQLKVDLPSGSSINRRIAGSELEQFFAPDDLLGPGTYAWRVQAACSTVPPYDVTPVSESSSFTVASGGLCPATVMDVDGNVYPAVKIGGQCWMQENLKVEHFRNGDLIPRGFSNLLWSTLTVGAGAVYDNLGSNKDLYGMLYNWYAVVDARGLCPIGWHVPSDDEWTVLTDLLGGITVAGGPMKATGTLSDGTGLWQFPNTSATNSSGFSGLPGGLRDGLGYIHLGEFGYWWSTSIGFLGRISGRSLQYNIDDVSLSLNEESLGVSVRCLRD